MNKISKVLAKRQEDERQERRERILTAAKTVFFKKGYIRATMRDIALEAALSPGLIYHYFENKDAIYGQICEEGFHILINTLAKTDIDGNTPIVKLEMLARSYIRFYIEYPEYFELISFKELGFKQVELESQIEERLNQLSLQTLTTLNDVVAEGISDKTITDPGNSWEVALSLWSSIEGLLFIHKRGYLETFNMKIEQLLDRQVALILNGILLR